MQIQTVRARPAGICEDVARPSRFTQSHMFSVSDNYARTDLSVFEALYVLDLDWLNSGN